VAFRENTDGLTAAGTPPRLALFNSGAALLYENAKTSKTRAAAAAAQRAAGGQERRWRGQACCWRTLERWRSWRNGEHIHLAYEYMSA